MSSEDGRGLGSIYETTQELPGDHHALNFARPLADFADLGVAHHALDWVFGRVPVPAVELDSLGRRAHAQLGGVELGYRRFLLERVAVLLHPGGMIDELLGGFDFGGHVGEGEVDALEARDGPAELFPG